jgi:ATP-dependent DNA helicase RecG
MAIETVDIKGSEVATALHIEEGHFADVKAIEIAPAKLTRSLAAFANADGGEIYIGIDERKRGGAKGRTWRGFPDVEAANGIIQAFEATFPLDVDVHYQFLRDADNPAAGLVLKAAIVKTPDIRRASDGTVYVRRGAQNLPVTEAEALRRLEYAKGVRSFETHTIDVPLEIVTNSETIIGFMLDVVPTGEPEPWLHKQLLIRDGMPTVAAVLVFSDEPQAALPKQSTIKVYRYATTGAAGTRATLQGQPLTIEGNVYDVIREAVATTVEMVESIRVMGAAGLEEVQYPEVALHEIITNAVLHRDYSIADDIHVRVFDNRIEVESPGRLPAHVTPENILDERFARNGNVVRWVNKFPDPPNKDVGEGLNTAFAAMRSLKLKAPIIGETASSVLVTIRHEKLASPEEMILEYLQNNEEISNSVVRELSGIGSENTVKRILQKMVKADELEPIPGRSKRAAAYRLPGAAGTETKGAR